MSDRRYVVTEAPLDGHIYSRKNGAWINGVEFKHKTADTARADTAAVADDPHLTQVTIQAAEFYAIEGTLVLSCASTVPDFKFVFTASAVPASSHIGYMAVDDGGGFSDGSAVITAEQEVALGTDIMILRIFGYIEGHATTDGTLDFQWAQGTSNANAVTLTKGSWLSLRRMS